MDQKLKQRLVGAIVLVSLAVIFIPIILEGPDDEWTPRSHSIPEAPLVEYQAEIELPLPEEIPASPVIPKPETASGTPSEGIVVDEPVETAVVESKPVPVKAPDPVPVAPTKPASTPPVADPASSLAGWYIQVGSFSQEMNATGLRERITAWGFDVRTQKISTGKGLAYRVLVGPSASRAKAEKLRDKLVSKHQIKGIVVEYPG
jgi:DedD protein